MDFEFDEKCRILGVVLVMMNFDVFILDKSFQFSNDLLFKSWNAKNIFFRTAQFVYSANTKMQL